MKLSEYCITQLGEQDIDNGSSELDDIRQKFTKRTK